MGPPDDGVDDQPIARMMATVLDPVKGDGEERDEGVGTLDGDGAQKLPDQKKQQAGKGTKRKVGASGFRGVAFHQVSGKFRARITSSTGDGRQRALGYFPTKEEAARAWDTAARDLGFAEEYLNFPDEQRSGGLAIAGGAGSGGAMGGANPHQLALPPGQNDTHAHVGAVGLTDESLVVGFNQHGRSEENDFRGDHYPEASVAASSMPQLNGPLDVIETAQAPPGSLPANRRKRTGNGTGVKGVRTKGNGQYEARIKLRGDPNRKCLGRFKTVLDAMRAYDDAARNAGYCVNECGKIGDLLDSDAYSNIGTRTPQIAKGVKSVSKTQALELTSREGSTDNHSRDATQLALPAMSPQRTALHSTTLMGTLGGNDMANVGGAGPLTSLVPGGEGAPGGHTLQTPLTNAEITNLADTTLLYAGFILDKPGIHRFLGIFTSPDQALRTVKSTIPDWKRKNDQKAAVKKQEVGLLPGQVTGQLGQGLPGQQGQQGQNRTEQGQRAMQLGNSLVTSLADDVARA